MSKLDIEQQDAAKLKAGYTGWFRAVEIAAIAAFWILTLLLAFKLAPFAGEHLLLVSLALAIGFILADFVSGIVHWLADTWGSADMPILGPALIRPFREHHVDQKAMTHHDYIETNGANCLVAVPVAAIALWLPVESTAWPRTMLFLVASIGSMIFWVMMTNQIHKWAHLDEASLPKSVVRLQRMHWILPVAHHQTHHQAPFATYYCITTGWLNPLLHRLNFFRHIERIITKMTGAIPRRDDIGLKAAVATTSSSRPESPR